MKNYENVKKMVVENGTITTESVMYILGLEYDVVHKIFKLLDNSGEFVYNSNDEMIEYVGVENETRK